MRYWCALAAMGLWIATGMLDWVPFFGFTGLIILIAVPILFGKADT
jgi:hypothetical protein